MAQEKSVLKRIIWLRFSIARYSFSYKTDFLPSKQPETLDPSYQSDLDFRMVLEEKKSSSYCRISRS